MNNNANESKRSSNVTDYRIDSNPPSGASTPMSHSLGLGPSIPRTEFLPLYYSVICMMIRTFHSIGIFQQNIYQPFICSSSYSLFFISPSPFWAFFFWFCCAETWLCGQSKVSTTSRPFIVWVFIFVTCLVVESDNLLRLIMPYSWRRGNRWEEGSSGGSLLCRPRPRPTQESHHGPLLHLHHLLRK